MVHLDVYKVGKADVRRACQRNIELMASESSALLVLSIQQVSIQHHVYLLAFASEQNPDNFLKDFFVFHELSFTRTSRSLLHPEYERVSHILGCPRGGSP
jgi:hypothetical protein